MKLTNKSHLKMIGAIAPSSKNLAKSMCSIIDDDNENLNILEIGAGTGAITKEILKKTSIKHHIDVVELIPKFYNILKNRFLPRDNLFIHCEDIRRFNTNIKYDIIISSLPFNAFSNDIIEEIVFKILSIAKNDALMTFFEYKWLPIIRPLFMNKKEKENFLKARQEINNFINKFQYKQLSVNLNIPPAIVHFLILNKSDLRKV